MKAASAATIADKPDEELLARNMIDVHGAAAATIARDNARSAALARQAVRAKSWIRVLGIIQRHQEQHGGTIPGGRAPRFRPVDPKLSIKG